ncbi:MAG: hypothetical protein ACE5Z5_02615 [Candidatus Bathyarchaeia archaeon]
MRRISSRRVRLPFLGRESFILLCTGRDRLMDYDRGSRIFVIRGDADLGVLGGVEGGGEVWAGGLSDLWEDLLV